MVIVIKGIDDSTVTMLPPAPDVNDHFRIWPDPASGRIWFDFDTQVTTGTVEIFTSEGRLCLKKNFSSFLQSVSISLPDLPSGLYLIRVKTPSGIYTERLIL